MVINIRLPIWKHSVRVQRSNRTLLRTRPSRRGFIRTSSWAGSLSLGRWRRPRLFPITTNDMKPRLLTVLLTLLVAGCGKTPNAENKKDLPVGAQMLFSAVDTLLKADERPAGITAAANVTRIKPLMRQVVDAGANANRAELNSFYPELGDHFLDDAVAHARFIIQFLETGDDDAMTRAVAAILRWQKWWGANKRAAMAAIINRYG